MKYDKAKLDRLRDERDEARAHVRNSEDRRDDAQKAARNAADYLQSVRYSRVEPTPSQVNMAEKDAAEAAEIYARRRAAADAANARYSQLAALVANLEAYVNAR